MLPPGLLQHTFDITIQSPGSHEFRHAGADDIPEPVRRQPGEQLNFLSFDHTTGRLVIEGSATVSADGLSVSTDPGTGITHPGWHGLTPQGSPTSPDDDDEDDGLGDLFSYSFTSEVLSDDSPNPIPPVATASFAAGVSSLDAVAATATRPIGDTLLTRNGERVRFTFTNTTPPNRSKGSKVQVKITVDPQWGHKYLDGLFTDEFEVQTGKSHKFNFSINPPTDFLKLDRDVLIGLKFKFEAWEVTKTGARTPLPESGEYYVYRYVDAMDDSSKDGVLKFAPTMIDGSGKVQRTRAVEYRGDPLATPIWTIATTDPADQTQFLAVPFDLSGGSNLSTLEFDPTVVKAGVAGTLLFATPGETPRAVTGFTNGVPYQLRVTADAVGKRDLYINVPGMIAAFESIANGVSDNLQDVNLKYTLRPGQAAPTATFVLEYNGRRTQPIPLNASSGQVQLALEAITGGPGTAIVAQGHLNGSTKITSGANRGGFDVKSGFRIQVPLVNGQRVKLKVLDPLNTRSFSEKVAFHTNDKTSKISPNERALIDTLQEREILAELVYQRVLQAFAHFQDKVSIHREAAPVGLNVTWITGADDLFGLTPGGGDYSGLKNLLERKSTLNVAQQGFVLAEALNLANPGGVLNYVNSHFETNNPTWDTPVGAFVQELCVTTAHELAHSLGIPHTALGTSDNGKFESQSINIIGGSATDFYTLNLAGEITDLICAMRPRKTSNARSRICPRTRIPPTRLPYGRWRRISI